MKALTANVYITKSLPAIDKLFFADHRLETFSQSLDTLSESELEQSFIASPLKNDGLLHFEASFQVNGNAAQGKGVTVTMRFLETSKLLEMFLLENDPLSDIMDAKQEHLDRMRDPGQSNTILPNPFSEVNFEDKIRRSTRYYFAFGTDEKVKNWSGPYSMQLAAATLKNDENNVRTIEVTLVPDLQSFRSWSPKFASMFGYNDDLQNLSQFVTADSVHVAKTSMYLNGKKDRTYNLDYRVRKLLKQYTGIITKNEGNAVVVFPQKLGSLKAVPPIDILSIYKDIDYRDNYEDQTGGYYSFKDGVFKSSEDFFKTGIRLSTFSLDEVQQGKISSKDIDSYLKDKDLRQRDKNKQILQGIKDFGAKAIDSSLKYLKNYGQTSNRLRQRFEEEVVDKLQRDETVAFNLYNRNVQSASRESDTIRQQAGFQQDPYSGRYTVIGGLFTSFTNNLFASQQNFVEEELGRDTSPATILVDFDQAVQSVYDKSVRNAEFRRERSLREANTEYRRALRRNSNAYRSFLKRKVAEANNFQTDPVTGKERLPNERYGADISAPPAFSESASYLSKVLGLEEKREDAFSLINLEASWDGITESARNIFKYRPESLALAMFIELRNEAAQEVYDGFSPMVAPLIRFASAIKSLSEKKLKNSLYDFYEETDMRVLKLWAKYGVIADPTKPAYVFGDMNEIRRLLYLEGDAPDTHLIDSVFLLETFNDNDGTFNGPFIGPRSDIYEKYKIDFRNTFPLSNEEIVLNHNTPDANVLALNYSVDKYQAVLFNMPVRPNLDKASMGTTRVRLAKTVASQVISESTKEALGKINKPTYTEFVSEIMKSSKTSAEVALSLVEDGRYSDVLDKKAVDLFGVLFFLQNFDDILLNIESQGTEESITKDINSNTLFDQYYESILDQLMRLLYSCTVRTIPMFNMKSYFKKPCRLNGNTGGLLGQPDKLKAKAPYSGDYTVLGFKHVISPDNIYSEFDLYRKGMEYKAKQLDTEKSDATVRDFICKVLWDNFYLSREEYKELYVDADPRAEDLLGSLGDGLADLSQGLFGVESNLVADLAPEYIERRDRRRNYLNSMSTEVRSYQDRIRKALISMGCINA